MQSLLRSAPVSPQGLGVVLLPGCATRGAALGMQVALAVQAAVLAPCGGDASHLAMFVGWVTDPVDSRVLHKQQFPSSLDATSKI